MNKIMVFETVFFSFSEIDVKAHFISVFVSIHFVLGFVWKVTHYL